ncbi:hypothetical protein RCL1_005817 [Eukaryota sp. TZLM3-RCL]
MPPKKQKFVPLESWADIPAGPETTTSSDFSSYEPAFLSQTAVSVPVPEATVTHEPRSYPTEDRPPRIRRDRGPSEKPTFEIPTTGPYMAKLLNIVYDATVGNIIELLKTQNIPFTEVDVFPEPKGGQFLVTFANRRDLERALNELWEFSFMDRGIKLFPFTPRAEADFTRKDVDTGFASKFRGRERPQREQRDSRGGFKPRGFGFGDRFEQGPRFEREQGPRFDSTPFSREAPAPPVERPVSQRPTFNLNIQKAEETVKVDEATVEAPSKSNVFGSAKPVDVPPEAFIFERPVVPEKPVEERPPKQEKQERGHRIRRDERAEREEKEHQETVSKWSSIERPQRVTAAQTPVEQPAPKPVERIERPQRRQPRSDKPRGDGQERTERKGQKKPQRRGSEMTEEGFYKAVGGLSVDAPVEASTEVAKNKKPHFTGNIYDLLGSEN